MAEALGHPQVAQRERREGQSFIQENVAFLMINFMRTRELTTSIIIGRT
jgi:hypothetical protein